MRLKHCTTCTCGDVDVPVTVNPFYLDPTPEELALLVRRRIDLTRDLAKGSTGKERAILDQEIERLEMWLQSIDTEDDDVLTIAVVEAVALDHLAAEERKERKQAPATRRGAMPVC